MENRIENPGLAPSSSPALPSQGYTVDLDDLRTAYVNFARLTGTPEELVLDFGLNTQMAAAPDDPIKLAQRLVLNYHTAKRLLGALHWAVQQHESVYGVLETDIQKRMRHGR